MRQVRDRGATVRDMPHGLWARLLRHEPCMGSRSSHRMSPCPPSTMCQLFALNSNSPTEVTFAFTGFSARGGATGEHADGFGLAFHDGAACRLFVDDGRASDAALAG